MGICNYSEIIMDLIKEAKEKYGINIRVAVSSTDPFLVMKASGKDTVMLNKGYPDIIKDELDVLKAIFYHEVGHLINYRKCLFYKFLAYLGAIIFGMGLLVILGNYSPYLYTYFSKYWMVGFVLPIIGLMIIRSVLRKNEFIADLFAARELGLKYYLEQLEKFKNMKQKQDLINKNTSCTMVRVVRFLASLLGYPTIEQRIKYLSNQLH